MQIVAPDSNEEVKPEIIITAYILIKKPLTPVPARSRSLKISEEDKYMQKSPFKFCASSSYTSFLCQIADILPCPFLNIIEDKITWKPQAPVRSPLPFGRETGFSALVEYFTNKKNGRIVMVMMPPPKKPTIEKPVH